MALLNNGLDNIQLEVDGLIGEGSFSKSDRLFGGLTVSEAESRIKDLRGFGWLHKCHYVVSMMPYLNSSILKLNNMSNLLAESLDDEKAIWYFVTQTNFPIMQTNTDSVKAGSFQVNRITGQEFSEIQMTFLDTDSGLILYAMQAAKDAKFLSNGLQRPPAQTAIWLRIGLFGRGSERSDVRFSRDFLVEVQAVEPLSLAGNDGSPVEVQVTFMQVDPFMGTR